MRPIFAKIMLWRMGIDELSAIEPSQKVQFVTDKLIAAGLNYQEFLNRCTFEPHSETKFVELAVSGGADSTAMFVLAYLKYSNVRIWHLDHSLRATSSLEAEKVKQLADTFSVPAEILAVKVEEGPNLEERARDIRKRSFVAGVATGHTSDDLVETMIINLLRGAGLRGLGSIIFGPEHPILALRRAETEAVCHALSIDFVVDESNLNPRFVRNRVRNEVIPLLRDVSSRDVVPLLARTASIFQKIDDFIELSASDIDPTDAKMLAGSDEIIATEAIRTWLLDDRGHSISYELANEVLRVARGEKVAVDLPGAVRVRRSKGRLSKFKIQ